MACPQVAGGNGLQIWMVPANTLNKQPRTANKGCFFSEVDWREAKTPHRKSTNMVRNVTQENKIRMIKSS
jgi:hypothetical protein